MHRIRSLLMQAIGTMAHYTSLIDEGSGTINEATLRITPIKHWNNEWQWWSFKHKKLKGQQPTYVIAKANHYNLVANMQLGVFATAADSDDWTPFSTQTIGDTDITLQHSSAFPSNNIHIAALPMYPFSRTTRVVESWMESALVGDTPSSSGGIIGYTTPRNSNDGLDRISPALPFYGMKISSGAGTKNKAILMSGNHPHETIGRFAFEGAIDWLIGGSVEATFLLKYFDFYIYPCVNPQGVYSGYFRSCPETPTSDNNRIWDTTGTNEAIDAIKEAIDTDTDGAIEVGIDYHGEVSADTVFGYAIDDTTDLSLAYEAKMFAMEATYDLRSFSEDGTTSKLFVDTLGASLDLVLEQGAHKDRTISNFKNSGKYSLQALHKMLADGRFTNNPGVGCRSFNGTSDRIDYSSLYNPTGLPITVSAWVYLTSYGANNYVVCIHDAGDASYGFIVNILNGDLDVVRKGATGDYLWYKNSGDDIPLETWSHIVVTSDGGLLSGSTALYVNGLAIPKGYSVGGGAETSHAGSISIGGRIYSDTRNFPGRVAQLGIWNRVLFSTEISNLAAGYSPLLIPSGLVFGPKYNTSSLLDTVSGLTGVADGTTQLTGIGNGPSIIY